MPFGKNSGEFVTGNTLLGESPCICVSRQTTLVNSCNRVPQQTTLGNPCIRVSRQTVSKWHWHFSVSPGGWDHPPTLEGPPPRGSFLVAAHSPLQEYRNYIECSSNITQEYLSYISTSRVQLAWVRTRIYSNDLERNINGKWEISITIMNHYHFVSYGLLDGSGGGRGSPSVRSVNLMNYPAPVTGDYHLAEIPQEQR